MAINVRDLARAKSGASRLEAGRKKIDTEEILGQKLTIVDFDLMEYHDTTKNEEVHFYIVVFEELPDRFYCAGTQLSDICEEIEALLSETGETAFEPFQITLEDTKTKAGNNFTKVIVW